MAYNGHFECTCYHPLFLFNQFGDLEREIEHLLTRPVGRPSHKPKVFYHSFQYQAKSWPRARRVVAKIEWHAGELFPRVGFIMTNLNKHSKTVVKFYDGRGTAEQWIKEGNNAVKWTKLSCRAFKDNRTRLQLFAPAYDLVNFLRRLALPRDVKHWSLTTLRKKLVKIGAKATRHSKYVTFQLAEVAVTRNLFAAILDRIKRLALPPPILAGCGREGAQQAKRGNVRGRYTHSQVSTCNRSLVGRYFGRLEPGNRG